MGTNMNDSALGSESLFILVLSSMAEVFIILRPSPILSDLMFGLQPRKNVITTSRWIKLCISDEALMTTTKKRAPSLCLITRPGREKVFQKKSGLHKLKSTHMLPIYQNILSTMLIWVSIDIILSFFSVCFLITWMFKRKWSVYIYGYE